jgi:hypothetical protein
VLPVGARTVSLDSAGAMAARSLPGGAGGEGREARASSDAGSAAGALASPWALEVGRAALLPTRAARVVAASVMAMPTTERGRSAESWRGSNERGAGVGISAAMWFGRCRASSWENSPSSSSGVRFELRRACTASPPNSAATRAAAMPNVPSAPG